jgi:hypothetical protein
MKPEATPTSTPHADPAPAPGDALGLATAEAEPRQHDRPRQRGASKVRAGAGALTALLLFAGAALAQPPGYEGEPAPEPTTVPAPAPSPASGFGAMGGAVSVGTQGPPEAMISYPLAEWPSIFHRWGYGEVVGLVGSQGMALGLGHRFADYTTSGGDTTVSLTLGPCYFVPLAEGTSGLRDGELRLFVSVSLRRREGT